MSFQPLLQTGLLLLVMFPYPQEPKTVGEIVEIGCSAEFKKTKNDKEEQLDPKRDRGRKIHELELYRCKGTGVLKLRVNDRDVNVTAEMEWHPIPEASDGDSKNTGGRPYEEMVWLNGSFKLNSVQNEGSRESLDRVIALHPQYFSASMVGFKADFSVPQNLSVRFNDSIVTVAASPTGKFAFSTDGSTQQHLFPDGTKWEFTALTKKKSVSIDWKLEDKIRSAIFVEPKGDNEILITRKIFVRDNPNPFITRMSYVRTPAPVAPAAFGKSFVAKRETTEELVTELMEPIDSKENGTFLLRVKEPTRYSGATIRGRFVKTFQGPRDKTGFTLVMEVKSMKVPTGGDYDIRGIVEKISAQDGTEILFEAEYPNAAERFLEQLKTTGSGITSISLSSASPLDKDITIPKGTSVVLRAFINKK